MSADGIVLVDKPAGMTSHDVVSRLRRIYGTRRIGHAGTLDPPATGLLVALVGRATKLAQWIGGGRKVYVGRIRFGAATETDDAAGPAIATGPVPALDLAAIVASRERFLGEIAQVPPRVSAVHAEGERAYRRVRKGTEVALAARRVTIGAIDVLRWNPPDLDIRVACGGGTYIRSLARDWGESLGTVAHLASLRRERSGPFDIGDARALDALFALAEQGEAAKALISPVVPLAAIVGAVVALDETAARRFANGVVLGAEESACDTSPAPGDRVVTTDAETFIGVGERLPEGGLAPRIVWASSGT